MMSIYNNVNDDPDGYSAKCVQRSQARASHPRIGYTFIFIQATFCRPVPVWRPHRSAASRHPWHHHCGGNI
ncbi:hypothetical protein J6590_002156 [Homalodisca vitripennis]|nr:hypothetical protein J6590_002156 [Homalodisca vitripennis]